MKFNPDNLNVHELAVEEPEKDSELPFDPERDITENDWENLKHHYNKEKEGVDRVQYGLAIKIIDLSKAKDFPIDKEMLEMFKEELNDYKIKDNWLQLSLTDIQTKILFFPETISSQDLSDDVWQEMKQNLNAYNGRQVNFLRQAALMRILRPERIKDIMSQKTWQEANDDIEIIRKQSVDWFSFALHAALMKILAAEDVKVTKNGLEINMRTKEHDLKQATPQMPEQKQF